jgi:two-component system OmpR family sensor kinase
VAIRIRLTLWYAGVTAAILSLFAVVVYVHLGSTMLHEVDRALLDAVAPVSADISSRKDPAAAVNTGLIELPEDGFLSERAIYLQVVRGNGSVAARSHSLGSQRLPLDTELLAVNMQGHAAVKTLSLGEGARLRVFSSPLVVSQGIIGAVQAGYPLHDIDAVLGQLLTRLTFGALLALVVAVSAGWWMSWLVLGPIDRITQVAAQIAGARDLRQRLPLPEAKDEIGRLVSVFNTLLDRLAHLIEAQQRLGADVSHELRTPLTTIRGNVDLLRRGAADDPRERAVTLDAIEVEVNRMSRLVADLLLLAQADAGMKLERQPVEMDTLLLQVYRQAQTIAAVSFPGGERVNIRLGHEDQATVQGDPDRLRQLLLNLMDNALKYTPRGGTITLSLFRETSWVRIMVVDTGVGIPPGVLPHIFERFYRAPQQGRKGVGLGLAIARWIAEAHGGRLEVESEVGRGTAFTLWLPEVNGPG